MVFGLTLKKKRNQSPPPIRPTPSLPDLAQARQAIVWPTSLVDQEEMKTPLPIPTNVGPGSPTVGPGGGTQWHRPFRPYSSSGPGTGQEGVDEHGRTSFGRFKSEAPLPPPTAFSSHNPRMSMTSHTTGNSKRVSMRKRGSPAFNVMVSSSNAHQSLRPSCMRPFCRIVPLLMLGPPTALRFGSLLTRIYRSLALNKQEKHHSSVSY